ncbi:MAG: choice-of-anchor D domain-containing protein [Chlorobi bacterium]|nr:choice-of-anchor D domain-containing protein [Chlorobiota bacterium]
MKQKITIWISMLIMLMITAIPSYSADTDVEELRSKLPKMLGANNVGTEFYMSFIVTFTDEAGGDSEIRLFISSAVETDVLIERTDKGFTKRVRTKANDIIFVDIPPPVAQPYTKMGPDRPLVEEVISGGALHVTANDPIIVYGMTRIIYASEGFLAIPVSSFGKEYISNTWNDPSPFNYIMGSWTNIVTAYDKTTIRYKMGGEDWSETSGGLVPGKTKVFNMNAGDVVAIGTFSKHGDVTGSVTTGNKPFGVLSGCGCAFIPTGVWACDMIVSMELPTNTWGTEYHVTKIRERKKASYMKVLSKEGSTTIYRDGLALGYIPKSGGINGEGWLLMRTTHDEQPRSVIVTADKPISITQFNPGANDDGANTDPFQMVLTPYEQYQDEIIFNTPGVQSQKIGFVYNFINIVYEATEVGTIPDDLLIGKVVDGKVEWTALNVIDADPGEEFAVKMRGKRYFMKTYQLPRDGVYKIKALKPFTAYAYGMSIWDTYGYPTSVALGDLSIPDTVAPDPQWEVDCFGNFDGTINDMPDDAAYRSNLSMIYMDSENSFNFVFEYAPFIAGETRKTSWNLEVIDLQQEARAVIVFSDRRGNDTTIVCEYFPTLISIHEDEYNYGRLAVGESAEHTFWVINDSEVGDLDLTQLKLKFGDQGFEIIDDPTQVIIPPLDSVSFTVKFTATEEGMFYDSIGVGDPCFFWYKAYIEANVGAPRITVGRYDFGDVTVDESKYGIVTVENIGSSALEIYSYTGPELKPVYTITDITNLSDGFDAQPSIVKPWVIKPGIEKTFEVKFTPDAEGIFLDSVVFFSNTDRPIDTHIDSVGELTGTGIKAYLVANGYDWLRRRIDRPGTFDIAPYDVDAPDKVIFLENKGTTPVSIKNIKISEDVVGDAFEFNRAAFINTDIDGGADMYVPVKFHPVATGAHTLRFTYNNTAHSQTETLLQGIGIVPRLETEDMDFEVTYVNDYPNVMTKTIPITNLSRTAWEYCDSVTITALSISPAGAIATTISGDVYGSEGFRFNIDQLRVMDASGTIKTTTTALPITLLPGEYIEVDAEFVATRPEKLTASITTVSDAETEQTSVWTGAGFNQDVIPTANTLTTCVEDPKEVVLTLTYTGAAGIAEVPISVQTVEITNAPTAFTFKDAADEGPFVLAPGATRDIVFIFDPLTAGTHTADVTITSDIPDNAVDNITLTADAVHYDRSVSVRIPADMNKVDDDHQLFEIGDLGTIYLQLDAGPDISMAQITTMNFTVAYEPEFIKVVASGIKSVAPGYVLSNLSIIKETGEISFDLNGPAFTNQGGVDLVEIQFGTYLPKTDKDNMDFVVTAEAGGSACVYMTATGSNVEVMKTCVYDLRKVQLSGTAYMLQAINPNPVKVSADINFSIGLETQTTIEIYNSAGELVAKPIDKILTSGQYSVNVPVSDLPSGTYRVVLRSGPFTEQQSMIIVK